MLYCYILETKLVILVRKETRQKWGDQNRLEFNILPTYAKVLYV